MPEIAVLSSFCLQHCFRFHLLGDSLVHSDGGPESLVFSSKTIFQMNQESHLLNEIHIYKVSIRGQKCLLIIVCILSPISVRVHILFAFLFMFTFFRGIPCRSRILSFKILGQQQTELTMYPSVAVKLNLIVLFCFVFVFSS